MTVADIKTFRHSKIDVLELCLVQKDEQHRTEGKNKNSDNREKQQIKL